MGVLNGEGVKLLLKINKRGSPKSFPGVKKPPENDMFLK